MNADPSKGCSKAVSTDGVSAGVATTLAEAPNKAAIIDPFLTSLKQGIYAGLVQEVTRIGTLAAKELERNIKLMATKLALEISNEVSVSSVGNTLTIKIELSDKDLQSIVSETLKNFKR